MKSISDTPMALKIPAALVLLQAIVVLGLCLALAEPGAPTSAILNEAGLPLLIATAAAALVGILLARRAEAPLRELSQAARAIADGELAAAIPAMRRSGAVGELAGALGDLQRRLGAAAVKGAAFEGSSVPMLTIDRDFRITFVNAAYRELFARHQALFREHFPGIDIEGLVGGCVDRFHKNPSLQRRLLSDPSSLPYRAEIGLGPLKFQLSVAAALDQAGNYIGNVLEWRDVTAERLNASVMDALYRNQGVIEFTLDGEIEDMNESMRRLLGYAVEETRGRAILDLVPAGTRPGLGDRDLWSRLRRGEFVSEKVSLAAKGGEALWFEAILNPVRDMGGKAFKVVAILNDVTTMEARIRHQGGLLDAISFSQVLMEFDPSGRILAANANLLDLMGYGATELIGCHHSALCDPETAQSAEYRRMWETINAGKACAGTFRRLARDGRTIYLQATYSPVRDERGAVVRVVKVGSDVTAAETERQSLVSRAFDQASILDAIGSAQAVVEFDAQGTFMKVNRRYLDIMGYAESDLIGRRVATVVEPEVAASAEFRQLWDRLARGEAAPSGTYRRLAQGNRLTYLQGAYTPVRDAAGEIARIVGVLTDVTEAESELSEALASVTHAANAIRNESAQLTQASDDLSHRTEQQAAALEQTAASIEELTASVRAAAQNAERANEDVVSARRSAEESGRIVRDAVTAMSEIEGSAQHISQIIGVIDDIAFQTNLLALNAGVEAARAGEAGRGFAVVASEVRALAQRTSDAAKEIKSLISTSSQHVGRGVELVRETGRSLETIVRAVAGMATLVADIASASREQAVGLTEINTAVSQLDQVTQHNAAMVEEATAASHTMRGEAESLTRLVAAFKAKKSRDDTGARAETWPSPRSAPAPVARISGAGQRRGPVAAPWATGGRAVNGHDPVEDWQEF